MGNLVILITPEKPDGFSFEIVTNDTHYDFQSMFDFDFDYLGNVLWDTRLSKKRKPYLLKFCDAAIGKDEEYEYDYPSGIFYSTFEFKSAKVVRVK